MMMVLNYGRMASALSNLGWVAQNEVFFSVPLTGEWNEDGKTIRESAVVAPFIFVDDQSSIAIDREVYVLGGAPLVEWGGLPWLAWPYFFSDSNVAVTEGREVLGLPTAFARISKGTDTWLEGAGATTDRQLLTVSATDFPAAGVGQQAIEQRLIEINRSDEPFAESGSNLLKEFKESSLAKYQQRGIEIDNLSLKEFRDEEDPGRPCYQGLIGFRSPMKRGLRLADAKLLAYCQSAR
jgi:hypothetical protein